MRKTIRIGFVFAFGLMTVFSVDKESLAVSYEPIAGAVHVHSTASTGVLSLEEIALRSETFGIDTVLLAENYHLQFAYNFFPLQGLLQINKSYPSLTNSTIAKYLNDVEDTNRRHPKVILIPGVETVPHYYWTGSLWRGDLTMHNGQKNILILGLYKPQDYQGLPVMSNPRVAKYNARSLIRATPILLVVAGIVLLMRQRERRYRIGAFQVSRRRRPWGLAAPLLITGLAWSIYNAPFTASDATLGDPTGVTAPYQALINYVDRLGGATIWSYPEAKDFSVHTYPPTRRFGLKFITKTDPYPEVLLTTERYTAFGAIYQDNTTAERPGQIWDKALDEYCLGQRDSPARGLGELGFHGGTHLKKALSNILTTFYVHEKTAKGVLEALGAGRMYATIPDFYIRRLVVRTFTLTDGAREVIMGETLAVPHRKTVTVRLALEAHDGTSRPFQATLVRNGEPWQHLEGITPFSITLEDTPPPGRKCTYYRLWMEKPHALITNPLFAASSKEIRD